MSNEPEPVFDDENPEWTADDFARARPAHELPPEVLAAFPKTASRIGRPPKPDRKVPISLRLDPEVLAYFRSTGQGWQSRINETLRAALPKR